MSTHPHHLQFIIVCYSHMSRQSFATVDGGTQSTHKKIINGKTWHIYNYFSICGRKNAQNTINCPCKEYKMKSLNQNTCISNYFYYCLLPTIASLPQKLRQSAFILVIATTKWTNQHQFSSI